MKKEVDSIREQTTLALGSFNDEAGNKVLNVKICVMI